MIRVTADSTPAEVLNMNTPQLCQMGKDDRGAMVGITIFRIQIAMLTSYLGAGWKPFQADECGELAYQECYWFTLAELKQLMVRIKTGRYSSHKNFTPAVFMEFLQEYAGEMHEARGAHYGGRAEIKWQPPVQPVSDETVSAALDQLTRILASSQENEQLEREQEKSRQQELKQQTAEKLKKIGVPDDFINQFWKK